MRNNPPSSSGQNGEEFVGGVFSLAHVLTALAGRGPRSFRHDVQIVVTPDQKIRARLVTESTDGRDRVPRQKALAPVLRSAVGDFPDRDTWEGAL
jgi:hypothetical protein